MGEAVRRKAEIAALKAKDDTWLSSLTSEERVIAEVSKAAYDKIVIGLNMTEGCYNLAIFLHEYLRCKYNIAVRIVIGWVNDGQWDGAMSHAWIEYLGKKVDISLYKTSYPDIQIQGDLIILDQVLKRGRATYTYWEILPDEMAKAMEKMSRESRELAVVLAHKKTEHDRISVLSSSSDGIKEYFRLAPPNNQYEYLARLVENKFRNEYIQ